MSRPLVTGLCAVACVAAVSWPVQPAAAAERDDGRARVLRRRVATEDGVLLALYRYVPRQPLRGAPPVLLIPDLGLGRAAFDVGGEGLSPFLSKRGRDVFVLELRGHGRSDSVQGARLEDVVRFDLPAAVKAIAEERDGPVDLVVHGWSGSLAIAASTDELRGRVRRMVALSTPVDPSPPGPYAEQVLGAGGRLAALARDPDAHVPFEVLFAKHGTVPGRTLARLRTHAFHDLPPEVAAELLAWMRTGDVRLGERTLKERLRAYDRPTLQLVALRNNWADPEGATPLRELATEAKVQLRVLSILHYLSEDYTHLSLLHGRKADDELFVPIARFLAAPEVGP